MRRVCLLLMVSLLLGQQRPQTREAEPGRAPAIMRGPQEPTHEVEPSRTPAMIRQEESAEKRAPQEGNIPKQVPARVEQFMKQAKVSAPQLEHGVGKPAEIPKKPQVAPHVHAQIVSRNPSIQTAFNNQFFTQHHFFPPYFNQKSYWWRGANWGYLNGYFGWGWATPVYYTEVGPTVYNQYNTTVYQQLPITQEEQTAQQETHAEWAPLGVFAVGRSTTDVVYSTQFMQLAVNRDGTLSGTYYNSATDKVHPLGGAVDKETQQAVWTVTDDPQAPLFTTGIYNLTEDVVNVQVSFTTGESQSWVLVRMQNGS